MIVGGGDSRTAKMKRKKGRSTCKWVVVDRVRVRERKKNRGRWEKRVDKKGEKKKGKKGGKNKIE